jgi:hypothetical protein
MFVICVFMEFIYPAGLVRVLMSACPELAAAIEQQQQSPAEAESLLSTRLLAAAALHVLRRCILADRPAQVGGDVAEAVFKCCCGFVCLSVRNMQAGLDAAERNCLYCFVACCSAAGIGGTRSCLCAAGVGRGC